MNVKEKLVRYFTDIWYYFREIWCERYLGGNTQNNINKETDTGAIKVSNENASK